MYGKPPMFIILVVRPVQFVLSRLCVLNNYAPGYTVYNLL
jgi:hypothetical protein